MISAGKVICSLNNEICYYLCLRFYRFFHGNGEFLFIGDGYQQRTVYNQVFINPTNSPTVPISSSTEANIDKNNKDSNGAFSMIMHGGVNYNVMSGGNTFNRRDAKSDHEKKTPLDYEDDETSYHKTEEPFIPIG